MGDTEAIWTVLRTLQGNKLRIPKVFRKLPVGSAPLALCNGSDEGDDPSEEKSSCSMQVDTLENQLQELRMLRMEIQAQT